MSWDYADIIIQYFHILGNLLLHQFTFLLRDEKIDTTWSKYGYFDFKIRSEIIIKTENGGNRRGDKMGLSAPRKTTDKLQK